MFRTLTACAFVALGCGASPDPTTECAAALTMPIYFGKEEPEQLDLTTGDRAAIGLVSSLPENAMCTGVLLPGGWVLTAAHCDIGAPLAFETSGIGARSIAVTSATHHPEHDVMLLELDARAASVHATPIPLWSGQIDETWLGVQVTLAGVGETEAGAVGVLHFVDEHVASINELEIRVDGMGQSGACVGDSGGPLLVAAPDASARIAGVLDRGSRSCVGIDVYTRVDRIRDWVVQVARARAPRRACDPG